MDDSTIIGANVFFDAVLSLLNFSGCFAFFEVLRFTISASMEVGKKARWFEFGVWFAIIFLEGVAKRCACGVGCAAADF